MNQSLANWKPPVTKPTSQKPTLEYTCIWTVFTSLLLLTSVTFIVILLYGVIFPISFRCSDELASQQIPASGVGTFFCLYRVPMMEPKNRSLCIKIGLPALAHFNAISSLSLLLDPFAFVRRQSTTLWIDKQTYRWAQVRLVLTRTILEYMLATQVSPLLSWAANLSLLVVTCESSWASWCSIRPHVRSSTGRLPTDLAAAKESSLAGRTTSSQHRIDDEIDHLADIFRPSGRPPARSEARLGAHSFGTNTDAKSLEKFVEARRTFWKRMHLAQHVTGSCAALQLLQLFAWRRVNFFTFVPVSIVLHVALLAVLVMCSLYSSSQRNLSSLTGSLRSAIWMCLLRVTWLIVAKFYRVYCENTDFHQWMRDSEVAQVLGLEFLRWVETGAVALYAYMWILLEVKDDAHGS
ncbi:hypothetical protein BC832DRAFT_187330 [Gaertneriomyces semiglobifer]|nr:hypothetical protein BC832DRAFT_187330 [Gaertneriomyces semiglobifer]